MSDTSGGLYRSSDEATSLLPPEISGSQAKFDVRFGKQIFRRGRRLAVVLSERVLNALAPPEHKPMGEMGSFIFLSNLIMGAAPARFVPQRDRSRRAHVTRSPPGPARRSQVLACLVSPLPTSTRARFGRLS